MAGPVDRRFFGLLWQSFIAMNGPIFGVGGVILSIAAWGFAGTATVPLPVVAALSSIAVTAIAVLVHAYYTAHKEMLRSLPCVRSVRLPTLDGVAILLLDPSDHYSLGLSVTVYHYEKGFESRVGIGRVTDVQDDGAVQVLLETLLVPSHPITDNTFANTREFLDQLRVKPSVHAHALTAAQAQKGTGSVGSGTQGVAS